MNVRGWSWPNVTFRQNGTRAGTTRNIIDTGALKSSLTTRVESSGYLQRTIVIAYDTPYASLVHYGGVIKYPYGNKKAASAVIPGRPWVEAILEGTYGRQKFNVQKHVGEALKDVWMRTFRP